MHLFSVSKSFLNCCNNRRCCYDSVHVIFACNAVNSSSLFCSTALSFTCAWYCAIVTAGMGYLFLIQLINISYNITERETRFALRDKTGDKYLCGLIIKTDEYNRGLLNNWKEFLRLQPHPRKPGIEDLV